MGFLSIATCTGLLLVLFHALSISGQRIAIENGIYNNIVLGVAKGTAQNDAFVATLEDYLSKGSEALNFALDGNAAFGDMTLIVPRDWDTSRFPTISPPIPELSIESSDILFYDNSEQVPSVLQAELCGVPGRQILMPTRFTALDDAGEAQYGTMGQILTHEWAHFRYGVHDEHGFQGDNVFPQSYLQGTQIMATSCFAGTIDIGWRTDCAGILECNPANDGCELCFGDTNTPQAAQASLGYLPALSMGKFCDSTTHNRDAPTQQNLLCGGRSITEVIQLHPDYENMTSVQPTTPAVNVVAEAIGRVLLLLEIQPDDAPVTIDYNALLNTLRIPLSIYQYMEIAVMTYQSAADGTANVLQVQDFTTLNQLPNGYDSLYDLLPVPAPISSLPALSDVFTEVIAEVGDYRPGTLVIMPLRNELITEGDLTKEVGSNLHVRRLKPLVLFAEDQPAFHLMGSFLQWAGAKFYGNTFDIPNPNSVLSPFTEVDGMQMATDEVQTFVDNTFQLDHTIVQQDEIELSQTESESRVVKYQGGRIGQLVAEITVADGEDPAAIDDIFVQYGSSYALKNCEADGFCTRAANSIFYYEILSADLVNGAETELTLTNNGPGVTLDITWSEIVTVGDLQEISVEAWFSHGRGPVASLPQNQELVLYVWVTTDGYQLLNSNINVMAELFITSPNSTTSTRWVELLDDGNGVDIRSSDSIFCYGFPEDFFLSDGASVEVTRIVVADLFSTSPLISGRAGTNGPRGSGLYTMDTSETVCCGSSVQDTNDQFSHMISGFRLILSDNLPVFDEMNLDLLETTLPPTTSETTTSDPGTTSTPEDTTTSEPPSTSSAEPTDQSTSSLTYTTTSSVAPLTSNTDPTEPTEGPGISTGAVVGIVFGCLVGAVLVGGGIYFLYLKKMACFAS